MIFAAFFLKVDLILSKPSSKFFSTDEWTKDPLNKPIYRKLRDSTSGQTFQFNIQGFDSRFQQPSSPSNQPSLLTRYYDSWNDWTKNPLKSAAKSSDEGGKIDLKMTFIDNPINSDPNDIFGPSFIRPREGQQMKYGPIDFTGKGAFTIIF